MTRSHEVTRPTSRLARYLSGLRDGTHGTFPRVASGTPFLSAKNVQIRGLDIGEESQISALDAESITASGYPRRGDVLLTIVGSVGRSVVYELDEPLPFQRSVAFLRVDARMEPRFLKYQLDSTFVQDQMALATKTSAQPGLYLGAIAALRVFVTPLPEQCAIADYLDLETAQIDTLIEEQQRLIGLLRERRVGVIADAVLAGVDPLHVPDASSLPFITLAYEFDITLGKMLDAGRAARDGDVVLPYIRAGNVQDDGLHLDDVNSMPFSAAEVRSLNLLAGDILVVEGGAVGTAAVVAEDMRGWSFQKTVNRMRARGDWSPDFVAYLLRTYRDAGVIDIICNKSTIPHLTAEKLRALRVPDVSPVEQRRIVVYLNQQTAKIDTLIAETERFIELVRECRTALITAAVTGQIDVQTKVA